MSRYFETWLRRSSHISRWVNFDLARAFHMRMACMALALSIIHGLAHMTGDFNYGSRPEQQQALADLLGVETAPFHSYKDFMCVKNDTGVVFFLTFRL